MQELGKYKPCQSVHPLVPTGGLAQSQLLLIDKDVEGVHFPTGEPLPVVCCVTITTGPSGVACVDVFE